MSQHINDQLEHIRAKWERGEPFSITTSGSTGQPKTIQLEKIYMVASARKTLEFLELKPGHKALLCLPLDKIAGVMMWVRAEIYALDLKVVAASGRPLEGVAGEFDFVAMVPMQVEQSLGELKRVKKLLIGGAPISNELEEKLNQLGVEAYHSYGMTETISHVALRRIGEPYFKAMPGTSFSVNSFGQLVIHAPDIGVHNMVTKDVVELRNERTFRWLGRADNVINSGGIKLHPEELERRIQSAQPFFLAAIADRTLGEKLVMVVESDRSPRQDEYDFSQLSKIERPKEIYNISAFRYTSNGKLQRTETLQQIRTD